MASSPLTAYDPSLTQNASLAPPRVVPLTEISNILTRLLSSPQGVDQILYSQRQALIISSQPNQCANLPIQTAGQPPYPPLAAGSKAQVCIKTGYVPQDTVLVSKCAGGGEGNNTGSVLVYDQTTLRLQAILCDEGLLTEIRTAAAAVVATRAAVHGRTIQKLGLIGGGVQAIWHLRLLAASKVIDAKKSRIVLKTTSTSSAEKFIQKMKESPYEPDRQFIFQVYDPKGEKFHGCQVIHTVTPSRTPVLDITDVDLPNQKGDFLHISAIGSDSPGKCELSEELILQANVRLVDSPLQARERGEFQSDRQKVAALDIQEIGSVLDSQTGQLLLVEKDLPSGMFSVFDSSGMAIQDVFMAKLISQNLQAK